MKIILQVFFVCLSIWIPQITMYAKNTEAEKVREIINKVNCQWQKNNSPKVRSFWDNAAYHTGNMEAYFLTGNDDFMEYSKAWAEHNQWKGAKSNNRSEWKYSYGESDDYVLFGDYQVCFQTYIDLYNILPENKPCTRSYGIPDEHS